MNIIEAQQLTKEDIALLKKPLSAYQYYIKDMREKWNNFNDAEKEKYLFLSEKDNQRYEEEKIEIKEIEYNEIRKLKIYLNRSYGRVSCVGLDNGFTSYEVVSISNAALIYGTKMGVELSASGIPVVVAGEAWIRGKGVTRDATSKEDYLDILNKLPFDKIDWTDLKVSEDYKYYANDFLKHRDRQWQSIFYQMGHHQSNQDTHLSK